MNDHARKLYLPINAQKLNGDATTKRVSLHKTIHRQVSPNILGATTFRP